MAGCREIVELSVQLKRQEYLEETNNLWINRARFDLNWDGILGDKNDGEPLNTIIDITKNAFAQYTSLITYYEANHFWDEIYFQAKYQRACLKEKYIAILEFAEKIEKSKNASSFNRDKGRFTENVTLVRNNIPLLDIIKEFESLTDHSPEAAFRAGQLHLQNFYRSNNNLDSLEHGRKYLFLAAKFNITESLRRLNELENLIEGRCEKLDLEAKRLRELATERFAAGDFKAARESFEEALRCYDVNIKNFSVHAKLHKAKTLLAMSAMPDIDTQSLIEVAQININEVFSLGLHEPTYPTHALKGALANALGDREQAIKHLETALRLGNKIDANAVNAWIMRANMARDASKSEKQHVLSLAPHNNFVIGINEDVKIATYTLLANFHEEVGTLSDLNTALSYYTKLNSAEKIATVTRTIEEMEQANAISSLPSLRRNLKDSLLSEKYQSLRELEIAEKILLEKLKTKIQKRSLYKDIHGELSIFLQRSMIGDLTIKDLGIFKANLNDLKPITIKDNAIINDLKAYLDSMEERMRFLTALYEYLTHIHSIITHRRWTVSKTFYFQFKMSGLSTRLKTIAALTSLRSIPTSSQIMLKDAEAILNTAVKLNAELRGTEEFKQDRDPQAALLFDNIRDAFAHLNWDYQPALTSLSLYRNFPLQPTATVSVVTPVTRSYSFWGSGSTTSAAAAAAAPAPVPVTSTTPSAPAPVSGISAPAPVPETSATPRPSDHAGPRLESGRF